NRFVRPDAEKGHRNHPGGGQVLSLSAVHQQDVAVALAVQSLGQDASTAAAKDAGRPLNHSIKRANPAKRRCFVDTFPSGNRPPYFVVGSLPELHQRLDGLAGLRHYAASAL